MNTARLDGGSTSVPPDAQRVIIAGAQVTNNITYPTPVPSGTSQARHKALADANCADFRQIPLGDLDFRHEIRLDDSGVAHRQYTRATTRRIYSARIEGRQSDMTVVVCQGENAEV
jgi:hypothetical protein